MKNITLKCIAVLLASASIISCSKKEKAPTPNAGKQAELNYQAFSKINSAFASLNGDVRDVQKNKDNANKRIANDCAKYTWFTDNKGKPVAGFGEEYIKLTINYSGTCSDGVSRSGSVDLYFWGWGDILKDSLVVKNLNVGGTVINGYRTSKNNSNYSAPNSGAANVRIEGNVKLASGESYSYSAAERNLWTGWDQVAKTGTGSLKDNQSGTIFNFNITSPLVHTLGCSWFRYPLSGVLEFTSNLLPGSKASINYGNGACDQDAVYTDPSGNSTPFKQQ
jgi:hypothetical protein